MSRRRGNAKDKYGRDRAGATTEKPKKERRRAVSNVGDIIARLLCEDPDCVGDVGKFGTYYLKYIGAFLKGKSNPNFIQQWDDAIVLQLKGKFNIKNIDQLYKSNYYEKITKIRQKWIKEAQTLKLAGWKKMVREALNKKGKDDRTIRRNIRDATKYKELQLKF